MPLALKPQNKRKAVGRKSSLVGLDAGGGLLRHKGIFFLRRQGAVEKKRADKKVDPANHEVHAKGKAKLHKIDSAAFVNHERNHNQRRAGHEHGGGKFPAGAEI